MRITFVLASGFGLSGGERTIAQWAKHLHMRGHQVLVVSPARPALSPREHWRHWKRSDFQYLSTASHFDHVPVPRKLLETYRPVADADVPDADFVIATWWETAEWVAAFAPRKGIKVHLIQHHEVFDYLPQARVAAVYRLPLHKIVIAPWLQVVMRERYGDANATCIVQGIDRSQFDAPPRGKQKIPTFGFMYSPLRWKGCDVVLQALALAQKQIPHMQIIAYGADRPTRTLPLPRGTHFFQRPAQNMLHELYAQCDAWLFGSRAEGFALPPMEAMACRTPVIGTRAGGEAELIAQGGMLVARDDAAAMAQHMREIAEMDEAKWRAVSDKAYAAVAPYTWERATDQFETALHEIAVRAQHRAAPQFEHG